MFVPGGKKMLTFDPLILAVASIGIWLLTDFRKEKLVSDGVGPLSGPVAFLHEKASVAKQSSTKKFLSLKRGNLDFLLCVSMIFDFNLFLN
jgi:hypothetical protein